MRDLVDPNDFNRILIEEFRANDGMVGGGFAGRPLLLLTTTGARSGQPRTVPLVYTRDGDDIVVIASKGGAPTNPDWFHNIRVEPTVQVEVGPERFTAHAYIAEGDERTRLFRAQAAQMPVFAEYERKTPREIPVVVLRRVD